MNHYTMADIRIGVQENFSVEIKEWMQRGFMEITGDVNPLHIDRGYALQKGYKECVVYGMLTASLYSTLVGVYLPGEKCILQELKTDFHHEVYVNDILTIKGEVVEINEMFSRVTIKAEIKNQNGIKVSKAKIVVGIL